MSKPKDSIAKTLGVATALCIVCSIMVSMAAVMLKPLQVENQKLDIKKNLLAAAGLVTADASKSEVEQAFSGVKTILVDLDQGVEDRSIDLATFDQVKAAKDAKLGKVIDTKLDVAKIKRRERYSKVYLIAKDGELEQIVLPVYGKGLWSTMYGFMALAADTKTIRGFSFYQHGETPGLGGEIDNKKWQASWVGKIALDADNFEPIIKVLKGKVNPAAGDVSSQVDGLSGATLTARGVQGLVNYWLGQDGFGPFLATFRQGGITL
jgi:Na+-transporting NADH:ubiquinone oxidoreductase subunit C